MYACTLGGVVDLLRTVYMHSSFYVHNTPRQGADLPPPLPFPSLPFQRFHDDRAFPLARPRRHLPADALPLRRPLPPRDAAAAAVLVLVPEPAPASVPPRSRGASEARRGRGGRSSRGGGGGGGGKGGGGGPARTLAACFALTAAAGSIPYFVLRTFPSLNDRDESLTHAQVRRGAFMNSGSRDAGRDPMWDFRTGQRVQDEAYVELFRRDGGPEQIDHGDRFLAEAQRAQGRPKGSQP